MFAAPLLVLTLQQWSAGPTLTAVVAGGDGVSLRCGTPYSTGVGVRVSTPAFLTHNVILQVSGRDHWMGGGACGELRALPIDGTYVEDDNSPLLGQRFVTTDARLVWVFVRDIASVSFGAGNAWRKGYDLPYLVFGASADVPNPSRIRVGLSLEDQVLRVTSDRFRRTWQNHQLVSQESLGRVYSRSHALIVGFHIDVPF
jgi:hypothetical protein